MDDLFCIAEISPSTTVHAQVTVQATTFCNATHNPNPVCLRKETLLTTKLLCFASKELEMLPLCLHLGNVNKYVTSVTSFKDISVKLLS